MSFSSRSFKVSQLEDLFKTCYAPKQVSEWIASFIEKKPEKAPYYEIIDTIYELQKNDTEPPTTSVIRIKVNEKLSKSFSTDNIRTYLQALENIIPGMFHFDGQYAYVEGTPEVVKERISSAISKDFPVGIQEIIKALF